MVEDSDTARRPSPGTVHRRTLVAAAGAVAAVSFVGPARAGGVEPAADARLTGIKAIVFDTVGTLLDTYGSITTKGARLTQVRGIETDWVKLLDSWRAEWRRLTDQIAQGAAPWRSADFVYREALDRALAPYDWAGRLGADDRDRLNDLWYEIDPWPDTRPGLLRLRERFTLSTLSNGSMASLVQMIKVAALPFDCVLTAELVRSAKPDPKVYELARSSLNLRADQILMVAAHKYDLTAAKQFGFSVAFLPRPLEFGPNGTVDLKPESNFDLTIPSLVDLPDRLA